MTGNFSGAPLEVADEEQVGGVVEVEQPLHGGVPAGGRAALAVVLQQEGEDRKSDV